MSDEVSHEVELALEAAAAYLREQQTEILCGINTFFVKENVLMMSQHSLELASPRQKWPEKCWCCTMKGRRKLC